MYWEISSNFKLDLFKVIFYIYFKYSVYFKPFFLGSEYRRWLVLQTPVSVFFCTYPCQSAWILRRKRDLSLTFIPHCGFTIYMNGTHNAIVFYSKLDADYTQNPCPIPRRIQSCEHTFTWFLKITTLSNGTCMFGFPTILACIVKFILGDGDILQRRSIITDQRHASVMLILCFFFLDHIEVLFCLEAYR